MSSWRAREDLIHGQRKALWGTGGCGGAGNKRKNPAEGGRSTTETGYGLLVVASSGWGCATETGCGLLVVASSGLACIPSILIYLCTTVVERLGVYTVHTYLSMYYCRGPYHLSVYARVLVLLSWSAAAAGLRVGIGGGAGLEGSGPSRRRSRASWP